MTTDITGVADPTEQWVKGTVEFTQYRRVPWMSAAVMGVVGDVHIASGESAVGFELKGDNQANWIALVRGPNGTVIAVPGCKVSTVCFGTPVKNDDFTHVP